LKEAFLKVGFQIKDVFGLVGKVREFGKSIDSRPQEEQKSYARLKGYFPSAWLMAIAPVFLSRSSGGGIDPGYKGDSINGEARREARTTTPAVIHRCQGP
jgi:hypothetical protein